MIFRPTDYAPAITFLLKSPVPNRHLIGFLRRAEPGELEVYTDDALSPAGVMLLSDSSPATGVAASQPRRDVDLDAEDGRAFTPLADSLRGGCYLFTFHRQWMIPLLWQRYEKISLTRSIYLKATRQTFTNRASMARAEQVRELREQDRPLADAYPDDQPSLRKCLEYTAAKWRGGERALRMLGFFDGGRLAAWVQFWMGAGMCEVMNIHTHPEFRRRGYAAMLLSVAVISIFKGHDEAYYAAVDDNAASIRLAESVGFCKESSTYYFLGKRRREGSGL